MICLELLQIDPRLNKSKSTYHTWFVGIQAFDNVKLYIFNFVCGCQF